MKGKSEFKKMIIASKEAYQKKVQEEIKMRKAAEVAKYQAIIDISYDKRHKLVKDAIDAVRFNPYSNKAIKVLKKALEERYFDIVDVKVRNDAFCTTELVINIWVWDGNPDTDMTEYHIFNFG